MKLIRELLTLRRGPKNDVDLLRNRYQFQNVFLELLAVELPALLPQVQSKKKQDRHLRGESLGGSDADLWSGQRVDHAIGFAGDGGAFDVGNRDRARALGLRFALGRSRVSRLA